MLELKTQSAIIMKSAGEAHVEHNLSIPSPDAGQLLIKVHAVALNPSDWMALDMLGRPGAGLGYDFSGEIVEIGEDVRVSWKVGYRVAGFVHGCHAANYTIGAFREYLCTDAGLVIRLPGHISFDGASTLGMGISTAAQALYQSLSIPLPAIDPTSTDQTILIYGGSTATGTLAIQLAKLSGLRVITTCSEQHTSWINTLGPDEIVDHKSPDAIERLRKYVQHTGLYLILDCIGSEDTSTFCYQCFTPCPREAAPSRDYIYAPLMPISKPPSKYTAVPSPAKILNKWKFVYTCFGKRFSILSDKIEISDTWQPSVEDKSFMMSFYRRVEGLIANEKIQLMPYEIRAGGLKTVLDGVSLVRGGKVRGKKLVYPISEGP